MYLLAYYSKRHAWEGTEIGRLGSMTFEVPAVANFIIRILIYLLLIFLIVKFIKSINEYTKSSDKDSFYIKFFGVLSLLTFVFLCFFNFVFGSANDLIFTLFFGSVNNLIILLFIFIRLGIFAIIAGIAIYFLVIKPRKKRDDQISDLLNEVSSLREEIKKSNNQPTSEDDSSEV